MSKFVHKIWLHFSEHTEKTFFRIHYLAIQVIRNVNYLTLLRSLLILQNDVLSWKNFWKTERQILFSFFKQKETTNLVIWLFSLSLFYRSTTPKTSSNSKASSPEIGCENSIVDSGRRSQSLEILSDDLRSLTLSTTSTPSRYKDKIR